jgi:hypothetical protein
MLATKKLAKHFSVLFDARVAQPAEHFLGKEEASGSSPDASSLQEDRGSRIRDRGADSVITIGSAAPIV